MSNRPRLSDEERLRRRAETYRRYRSKPEVKARKAAWAREYQRRPHVNKGRIRLIEKARRMAKDMGISTRAMIEALGGTWRKA